MPRQAEACHGRRVRLQHEHLASLLCVLRAAPRRTDTAQIRALERCRVRLIAGSSDWVYGRGTATAITLCIGAWRLNDPRSRRSHRGHRRLHRSSRSPSRPHRRPRLAALPSSLGTFAGDVVPGADRSLRPRAGRRPAHRPAHHDVLSALHVRAAAAGLAQFATRHIAARGHAIRLDQHRLSAFRASPRQQVSRDMWSRG